MNDYNELFANNLKYYLNLRGYSQAELSRLVEVSTATISDWCNGKKIPGSMKAYMKLAAALSITVADLFDVYHHEQLRRLAAYAERISESVELQSAVEVLARVPNEDLPRVTEMIKIFARKED